MKALEKSIFLFYTVGFLLICILFLQVLNTNESNIPPEQFYCGTRSYSAIEDSAYLLHENGGELFKENCKSCHKLYEASVGPALAGISGRRPRKWLYAFIRNSKKMIQQKDTMAVAIYTQYLKAEMTAFPDLSDVEIDSILMYLEASSQTIP